MLELRGAVRLWRGEVYDREEAERGLLGVGKAVLWSGRVLFWKSITGCNACVSCPSLCVHCACWVASVVSESLQPHRLQPARLLCPWDAPGKNTGLVALPSSRGFSQPRDRTSSPYLLYCRQIFYPLSHLGSLFSHFYSIFLMFFPLIKMLSFLRSIFTYHILLWFSSQVVFFVKPPWLFNL